MGQMAIMAITLRGFKDLGRSVTPIFLSMIPAFSLPIFYVLQQNEKNLWSRSLKFLQNVPSNSTGIHLTSSFSCATVSNAPLRVKVCENNGNI